MLTIQWQWEFQNDDCEWRIFNEAQVALLLMLLLLLLLLMMMMLLLMLLLLLLTTLPQLQSKKTFAQCGVKLYDPSNSHYRAIIR